MKTYSFGIILVGVVWVLSMYWLILGMDAITTRGSISAAGTALLLGPILLICAPILVLTGFYAKIGAGLTLLGAAILTGFTIYVTSGLRSMRWVEDKPFFAVCAVLITVTLFCDLAAIRVYQLVSNSTPKLVS